jgi:hypothetical protein
MEAAKLCHTCRWGWHFKDEDGNVVKEYGLCRRYAPKPKEGNGIGRTAWPVVHLSDGCGEWTSSYD